MRTLIALSLMPFAAACATTVPPGQTGTASAPTAQPGNPTPRVSVPVPSTRPTAPVGAFIPPRVMNVPGLEGVIGQSAAGLQAQFGPPRLDVVEGDVRKLQFAGEPCVLDVYLYPARPGAEPTATYVDARRSSDALDVDRAACVRALKGI
ncbi:hypothetical protein ACFCW2_05100 [Qipengyuania sp. DSG2-2]|uniref:hypothetical protein n=1 Tax=Qipengyuania sp. DGS2-2 TaxID=3349631 RepID=UPI0036D38CCC